MDAANYYITTLTNAFMKIGPIVLFLVGGYFIFIKMPFLFLKKSMNDQKRKLQEENKDLQLAQKEKEYSVEDYKEFQRKMKLMSSQPEKPKVAALGGPERPKTEQKKKEEKKREEVKKPQPQQSTVSPEEILGFKANQSFTKSELKKRYFDKLKENHPDRVASMGEDFKKLAEKNTKEINKAYEKLKNRAA